MINSLSLCIFYLSVVYAAHANNLLISMNLWSSLTLVVAFQKTTEMLLVYVVDWDEFQGSQSSVLSLVFVKGKRKRVQGREE